MKQMQELSFSGIFSHLYVTFNMKIIFKNRFD